MKSLKFFWVIFAAAMLCVGCETALVSSGDKVSDSTTDQNVPVDREDSEDDQYDEETTLPYEGIVIYLPDWSIETKAYSRTELTTPELAPDEKVAVATEDGRVLAFTVVESEKNKAVLRNPDVELEEGASYRIQYPYPEVTDQVFMMSLGFGGYECTPSLDWMVSKWRKFKKDETLNFNLKRINSALIFDVIAPFSGEVEEVRLYSAECMFCVKGAFDCRGDDLTPDRTTWASQFPFPAENMTWEEGQKYTLIITLWPFDYSTADYTIDIYMADDRGATALVSIPELKQGKVKEYEINEFEILVPPVYKKDVIEQERVGYEIVSTYEYPGELY